MSARAAFALAVAALTGAVAPATAGPLDEAIAATRPCEALPGFDRTDDLRIERVDLTVRRDVISFRAEGDIACTASGSALIRGNLTARAKIAADLDAATCELRETSVELAHLGGTAGAILAPRKADLEVLLAATLATAIVTECRRSLGAWID
jgi:hypothetical protein